MGGPKSDNNSTAKEMEPLQHIGGSKDLQHLLKHPVIMSYLHLKWYNVRAFFYSNLIIYTLFVILMTAYILIISGKYAFSTECLVNSACMSSKRPLKNVTASRSGNMQSTPPPGETTSARDPDEHSWLMDSEVVAVICIRMVLAWFLLFLTCREVIQLIASPRHYLLTGENYLEVLLLVCSSFILCNASLDPVVERHLGAVTILLLWTELIMMTGKLPLLSLQLEMLKKVSTTFLRFMAWYSLLIIAFALSFFTLFRSGEQGSNDTDPFFDSVFLCVVRTVAMIAGEFDTSTMPFGSAPGTSHTVFVVFVFLITIVLLNLLNGLAVSDTHAIREHSVVLSLASMVRLLAFYETVLAKMAARVTAPASLIRFLRQRLYVFDRGLARRQLHVFPASREVKFLSDAETTEWFSRFRMDIGVIHKATAILKTAKDASDTQQMVQRIDRCEKKVQKLIKDQAEMRNMVSEAITVLMTIKDKIKD